MEIIRRNLEKFKLNRDEIFSYSYDTTKKSFIRNIKKTVQKCPYAAQEYIKKGKIC